MSEDLNDVVTITAAAYSQDPATGEWTNQQTAKGIQPITLMADQQQFQNRR